MTTTVIGRESGRNYEGRNTIITHPSPSPVISSSHFRSSECSGLLASTVRRLTHHHIRSTNQHTSCRAIFCFFLKKKKSSRNRDDRKQRSCAVAVAVGKCTYARTVSLPSRRHGSYLLPADLISISNNGTHCRRRSSHCTCGSHASSVITHPCVCSPATVRGRLTRYTQARS